MSNCVLYLPSSSKRFGMWWWFHSHSLHFSSLYCFTCLDVKLLSSRNRIILWFLWFALSLSLFDESCTILCLVFSLRKQLPSSSRERERLIFFLILLNPLNDYHLNTPVSTTCHLFSRVVISKVNLLVSLLRREILHPLFWSKKTWRFREKLRGWEGEKESQVWMLNGMTNCLPLNSSQHHNREKCDGHPVWGFTASLPLDSWLFRMLCYY